MRDARRRCTTIDDVSEARRREEQQAAQLANYTTEFWDLPEAFIRPGFTTLATVFDPQRQALMESVAREVDRELRIRFTTAFDAILVPLGCGDHIDHRMVRDVAIDWARSAGIVERLIFYEDLPYAGYAPESRVQDYVRGVSLPLAPIVLGSGGTRAKLALLHCYSSQLASTDLTAVMRQAERVGGERLWMHAALRSLFPPGIDIL